MRQALCWMRKSAEAAACPPELCPAHQAAPGQARVASLKRIHFALRDWVLCAPHQSVLLQQHLVQLLQGLPVLVQPSRQAQVPVRGRTRVLRPVSWECL